MSPPGPGRGLPDGQGAGLALSGAVSVAGGAAVWRDLVGDDGFGDLLVTDADLLTSPGDVNGDGYADLVVRQASTGDVYFHGGTADHRVKARVRIGADWKLYKKLVGAGDLNGDGRGDLLGVDASGVLWRYYGTATGGVTARARVGGWGAYSSLVGVGDLSGDGRADLVARDTAGKLWRYSGTGTGAYGARVAIGSGWSTFKGLY
ncbi:FG-GAP repeat domain-containing protein [Streptomyces tanashiensis]|uniref:FG-GAP repeat domain-containing protein n=1 Tax=Streptomyces tanashiensis TaxID=67367 RepID=UPI001E526330|nr:VCBS repeat-containing protein [Streptomyces tanashiensis]